MKRTKIILLLVTIALWVSCQSCLQFRMSDKKQHKELHELPDNYKVAIGSKTVQKRNIHYTYITSDTIKPLAIFIHGSPGSSSNFLRFGKDSALLKKYNILLLDRPGFGYSDFGSAEPSILTQAEILNGVIDSFSAPAFVLIGHSLGGPIIAKMAMNRPNSYQGLLIVAGSVSPELEPEEKWRKTMQSKALRWTMPKSFRVSNDEIIPAKRELEKMESDWKNITCETQIIQGGKDKLVPPGNEDYAEKMLINAKKVTVYRLENQDHFIPFTSPQLIVEALLRFTVVNP